MGDFSVTLTFWLIEIDFGEGVTVSQCLCPLKHFDVLKHRNCPQMLSSQLTDVTHVVQQWNGAAGVTGL